MDKLGVIASVLTIAGAGFWAVSKYHDSNAKVATEVKDDDFAPWYLTYNSPFAAGFRELGSSMMPSNVLGFQNADDYLKQDKGCQICSLFPTINMSQL